MGPGLLLHLRQLRIPGDQGGGLGRGEGGDDIGIGGVDRLHVRQLQPGLLQPARQQVVRHRVLDQVHRPALDVGQPVRALQDDAIIAVGVVADHQDRGIPAPGGRDGERVHGGRCDGVHLAGAELVQGFDVVVDLDDLDPDSVLVGPLLEDAGLVRIGPGHPPGVDGPGHGVDPVRVGRGRAAPRLGARRLSAGRQRQSAQHGRKSEARRPERAPHR